MAGVILLTGLSLESRNSLIVLIMILTGVGFGFTMPVFNIAVQNAFPKEQVGMVTSVLQFFRLLGTTVFSAVFGTVLSASMSAKINNIDFGSMPDNIAQFLKNPQSLTNATGINAIRLKLSGQSLDTFNSLLKQLKLALVHTIDEVFIVCVAIAVVTLVLVFCLKQLPMQENTEQKK